MIQKYCLLTVAVCVLLCCQAARSRCVVVDASDRMPLAGASVFDRTGTLVAITDGSGAFDSVAMPATVRCLGYEARTVGDTAADTLALTPASYALGDVTVDLADREVLRLVCYVRGYSGTTSATDTTMSFGEYMVDYMLPLRRLKHYKGRTAPRVLAGRSVSRAFSADGTDSVVPRADELQELWLRLASVDVPGPEVLPDSLRGTTGVHTTPGKYGPAVEWRITPDRVVVSLDALADKKGHRWSPWFFKLLGITTDFTDLRVSTAYGLDENGAAGPESMQVRTFAMSALGRGKYMRRALDSKTPVDINIWFEIYPVEREYLTAADAKAADKAAAPATEIMVPAAAPAVDVATARLLESAGPR